MSAVPIPPSPLPSSAGPPAIRLSRPLTVAASAAAWLAASPVGAAPEMASAQVAQLEVITVTATRTPRQAIEAPAAVSVIGLEEIRRRQAQSLDDLLRHMPSVELSGGPRTTAEQPTIRGLGDERIVLRLDGARQNFQAGHKGRAFLDPSLLRQVDVLRGPASALYGSGAVGGVIALTTKDARDFLAEGARIGGQVRVSWRANGNERVGAFTGVAAPADTVGLLASVTRREAGDVETGAGTTIPFSGDDLLGTLVKADWTPAPGHRLRLSWQGYGNDQRLPSAPDTDDLQIVVDRTTRQDTATLSYEGRQGAWFDLRGAAYWTGTGLEEDRIGQPRRDETVLDTVGIDLANTSRFQAGPAAVALTVGVEAYRDAQTGRRDGGPRPQFPDADGTVLGLFVQAETTLADRLTLTPALRWDRVDQSAQGQPDRGDGELSPGLRAAYAATAWLTVFAGYAEAFRSPSLTELYNTGLHFPGICPVPNRPCVVPDNFFVPNPGLRAERAATWEAGANLDFGVVLVPGDRLLAKAAAFRNDVDDFIEQTVLIREGRTLRRNVREARIDGVELEATYDGPGWFASAAASLLRGEDVRTGAHLDGIPADRLTLALGREMPDRSLTVGWRTTLTADQDRVAGDSPTAGYAVHEVFLTWQPVEALRLDLGIDNIFDKAYRRHLSSIPEAGRTVKASATLRF